LAPSTPSEVVSFAVTRDYLSKPANPAHRQTGATREKAQIVHFQRRAVVGHFSIECLFESLRAVMHRQGCEVISAVAPYASKGLFPRVANVWWAWRHRSHVNHITGDVHFLALGLPPQRTILTIHDCFPLVRFTGFRRWFLRTFWFDLPIRRSAVITVISEETKQQLMRHVQLPQEKVIVIPDAAAEIFRPCPRPFHEECPTILHVGTGMNKNLPRLIEALHGIRCQLKIIGELDEKTKFQLRESRIQFQSAANLDEAAMYQEYCDADMVSFASTYEGFGMPIIEAQWVERPVVTSNCSSMPEIAGKGACFVDPFNVQSIRRGIMRVIDDSVYRAELIEEGRRNRERFSLEKVAGMYLELYERVTRFNGNQT
jgi:glycosyltransferase involved in cell wall biosynthesis